MPKMFLMDIYQDSCDEYCFVIYIERYFKEVKIFQVKILKMYP